MFFSSFFHHKHAPPHEETWHVNVEVNILTEEQRQAQRNRAAERRSKLPEEQRQAQRDRDAARKRANYTPRQLLAPNELALDRAKARDNYTPRQLLAPNELALDRAKARDNYTPRTTVSSK